MSSLPIVEAEDVHRDCLLFRLLQVFVADRLNLGQPAALSAARNFMNDYQAAETPPLTARELPQARTKPKDARFP